jgi:hypothetical protein
MVTIRDMGPSLSVRAGFCPMDAHAGCTGTTRIAPRRIESHRQQPA